MGTNSCAANGNLDGILGLDNFLLTETSVQVPLLVLWRVQSFGARAKFCSESYTKPPGFTGRHASRREGPVPASQLEAQLGVSST